jgi:cytochrome c-type biogenesis protein CcmH
VIVFWIVVSLFLIGLLLMLLPPLWKPAPAASRSDVGIQLAVYRDQLRESERDVGTGLIAPDLLDEAHDDIRHRWLEEAQSPAPATSAAHPARVGAIGLALLLTLGSVGVYLVIGDPQSLLPAAAPNAKAPADARHSVTPEQIQKMVESLAERLKTEPDNAEGWMMLGRSYTALGRHRDAVEAFRRANTLAPGNPSLLADFADVLGMTQGRRLAGEPARLIQQALDADPRHGKALALAGSVAFEARDYTAARAYWERLIAVIPAGSDNARSVQGSIAEARQLESRQVLPVATTGTALTSTSAPTELPAPSSATAGATGAVAGQVLLKAELASRIAPGDTLFIFARAAQGPRMPLAIVKRAVAAWPSAFVLDDSMAMAPNLKLSGFDKVVVSARISKSGNATPQPGDLIGQSAPVAPGALGLRFEIDQVQP